ncbi:MAG: DNA polymerase III subunit gamma/tau [Deltaproteobacteria bacterium]|nr:DNA polymerase III subunit gamma/tau [Deltaproteobacteria bacterium]
MPYEVLARKWRPQVFQDVIGQEHTTQTLTNAITSGRLAHAYLFGGPRGVGKTSVARILAKAINCEQGEPATPCNTCHACLEITAGSSIDVQEIDGASNRGIDEIRELREGIKYMPTSSRYRIFIIDEVHMLTKEAFNALLKTLEEPPAHVKFIFATTESHKVPVTILSRCQRFDFKRIPLLQIVRQLEDISREESIDISESGLNLIAREAEGSMRDAESLLDQVVSFSGPKVEDNHIIEILGIIDRGLIFEASRAILEGSPEKCLGIVEGIYDHGHDIKEFYRALMTQFRDLLVSLIAPQDHLLDMSKGEIEETTELAETAGSEKLQMLLNFMINREDDLRFTSHPRLILETIMIKLCHVGDVLSFDDILKKMKSLEKRLVSAAAADGPAMAGGVSEPGKEWDSGPQEKAGEEETGTVREGPTWDDFLTFLASQSKSMANVLRDWQFLGSTDNTIDIARGSQSFSATYFDDKEHYARLSDYCRDFFHKDIRIKQIDKNRSAVRERSASETENTHDETPKYSGLTEPVQDILDMFQGEVKGHVPTLEAGYGSSRGDRKNEEGKT